MKSSHPIEVKVNSPDEISQIFDSISYCKGSSIIRMLNSFIGPKHFAQGLQNYLNKFKYKNATTDDLWNELNESSKKDVKSLMRNWTLKKGYPLVSVSISYIFFTKYDLLKYSDYIRRLKEN